MMNNWNKSREQLRALSNLLDSKFTGPFGFRFGLDGILGLIPGVGDLITSALSVYIIAQAANSGVSSSTLIRMAFNVILENIIDMVPIFGSIFDFYWKANIKNVKLLEDHMASPEKETIKSRMIVALIALTLLSMVVASAYFTFQVFEALFYWLASLNGD